MRLFRVAEACERLGVSKPTLYRFIGSGELESVLIGPRSRRIPEDALEAFVARKQVEEATADAG